MVEHLQTKDATQNSGSSQGTHIILLPLDNGTHRDNLSSLGCAFGRLFLTGKAYTTGLFASASVPGMESLFECLQPRAVTVGAENLGRHNPQVLFYGPLRSGIPVGGF